MAIDVRIPGFLRKYTFDAEGSESALSWMKVDPQMLPSNVMINIFAGDTDTKAPALPFPGKSKT